MKPLDEEMILKLARDHEILITIEEGSIGGFGSHVMQYLADHGMLDSGLRMRSMVLPDVFLDHDTPTAMYGRAGLDAKGIVAKVFEALGKDFKAETRQARLSACFSPLPLAGRASGSPGRIASKRRCGWGLSPHGQRDSRRHPLPSPPPQERERERSPHRVSSSQHH